MRNLKWFWSLYKLDGVFFPLTWCLTWWSPDLSASAEQLFTGRSGPSWKIKTPPLLRTLRATTQNKDLRKVILFQTQSQWWNNYSTLSNMGEPPGILGINTENIMFNSLLWMRPKTLFLHWLVNKVIIFNYRRQSYLKNPHKARIFWQHVGVSSFCSH